MKTILEFPRKVIQQEDVGIVMPDGCRLSARIWMPEDAAENPVPVIVEHLPYRKRDGTTARDCLTHPYLAGHGYACIRVDMRGNGDSQGIMEDEYTRQELLDACDVIAWAADQPWCTGKAGMMGISWGGFNALQVAALRPPALKAIITLCSTDDRYADDIHYKGGLLLHENLGWGATMFSFSSRPPDPAIVGDAWREMWLARLEANPMLHARWLSHPTRDAYWQHGSVCEDYGSIEAAVLAVGGWGDAYKNAVGRLVARLKNTPKGGAKGIVGPWIHKYPHFAKPNPIGFLQEALRWWDHWLKDADNGAEKDPAMRQFVMDSERPEPWYEARSGRWIAEKKWPSRRIRPRRLSLTGKRMLKPGKAKPFELAVASPADTGLDGGEYCAIYWGPELADDQRRDDALSLTFDSAPLKEATDIVGGPVVRLRLKANQPVAQVAVRLNDVYPDGASTRITYGVLNLCHREGHDRPKKLKPGKAYDIEIRLDDIAWRVPAGNRLRFAISQAYWPMVWPSPAPVTLTLEGGELELPLRPAAAGDEWRFGEPEAAAPWAIETLRQASNARRVETDKATGVVTVTIEDDFGETRDLEHGLVHGSRMREVWTIHPDDPLSARGEASWEQTYSRGDWSTRIATTTSMWSDGSEFTVEGRVDAFEGHKNVFGRDYKESIARGFL
ncbi:MAG: CocE/NonD family hydrolase [Pseudomonadota bacterium]|nr:CocE/NonD family hydrolase [Pseudomonadota bacterium]